MPYIEGQGELRLGLRPPDGEPPVAGSLRVRVVLEDGAGSATKGALPLVAEVTTASVERLALREGEPVVASFKATAARLLPLA